MLINVDDPLRDLVLNACFYSISVLTLVAILPWKAMGVVRLSDHLRWLALPVLALAVVYESFMPARFDIRVDLFLLLPAYALVIATSAVRWRAWNRTRRR